MTTTTASLIQIDGIDSIVVSATDAARTQRDELLALARRGKAVTNADSAERAAVILKDITAFTRTIEGARKEVKAPILDQGKRIDSLAAELTRELEMERDRISRLVGGWQAEQRRIEEEARRKAREEEQRIRREAEEKQRAAEEAARREREAREALARAEQERLEKLAAQARTEVTRQKRQAEMEAAKKRAEEERLLSDQRRREAAEKAREEAEIASARAQGAAMSVVKAKPSGIAARKDVQFEVSNIQELYDAAPAFVLLSPNNAAIKAALKAMPEGQSLPGVKHWWESKAIVRG